MENELIEVKLIDSLVQKRTQLIEHYLTAIQLQKTCHQLAEQINGAIPADNAGYHDDFTTVFYDLKQKLGETSAKRHFHRESSILTMSEQKLRTLVTHVVDSQLWRVLFNRFGLKSMMSDSQKADFDNTESPLPFTCENVRGTLTYWLEQSDNIMLSALMDTVTSLGKSYISNQRFKVGTRIIIDESIANMDLFTLNDNGPLRQILNYVWRLCFGGGLYATEQGLMENSIWVDLSDQLKEAAKIAGGDVTFIDSVFTHDIEIRFFKNKKAHLFLPENVINVLNDKLASENYLAA